jgi:hypothetical protein
MPNHERRWTKRESFIPLIGKKLVIAKKHNEVGDPREGGRIHGAAIRIDVLSTSIGALRSDEKADGSAPRQGTTISCCINL